MFLFLAATSRPTCILHRMECYLCFIMMRIKRQREREVKTEDERGKDRQTDATRHDREKCKRQDAEGRELKTSGREKIIIVFTDCGIFFRQLRHGTVWSKRVRWWGIKSDRRGSLDNLMVVRWSKVRKKNTTQSKMRSIREAVRDWNKLIFGEHGGKTGRWERMNEDFLPLSLHKSQAQTCEKAQLSMLHTTTSDTSTDTENILIKSILSTISRKELLRNGPDKRAQGIVNYKTAWLYSFWIASLTRHMMRADQSETPGVLPPFFFRCPSSGNTSSPRPYLIGALLFPWSGTWPIVCHFKGQ